MSTPFRHSAAFGKRIEFFVVGRMLKEGLDVYLPLVDDDAIDAVIKRPDGKFVEVQIKARSRDAKFGSAANFAALRHELRENYWFVFYSERMDKTWIMSSREFIRESTPTDRGKNIGIRAIQFNGKNTRLQTEHVRPQYVRYLATDFQRLLRENPEDAI